MVSSTTVADIKTFQLSSNPPEAVDQPLQGLESENYSPGLESGGLPKLNSPSDSEAETSAYPRISSSVPQMQPRNSLSPVQVKNISAQAGNVSFSVQGGNSTTVASPVQGESPPTIASPVQGENSTTVASPVQEENSTTVTSPVQGGNSTTVASPEQEENFSSVTSPVQEGNSPANASLEQAGRFPCNSENNCDSANFPPDSTILSSHLSEEAASLTHSDSVPVFHQETEESNLQAS